MSEMDKYINDETLNLFFVESKEGLESFESALLEIEKGESSQELLDLIFRSAHTIKGSSGMFGFEHIEKFTHIVENLLDDIRNGIIVIDKGLIDLLLECKDHIGKLLFHADENGHEDPDEVLMKNNADLLSLIGKYIIIKESKETINESESLENIDAKDEDAVENQYWHISLRFGENLYRNGMEPSSFVQYLEGFGEVKHIVTIKDSLPTIEDYNPESCYLGIEIDFDTSESKDKIEGVFDFLCDDCQLRILPPQSSVQQYCDMINELPEDNKLIGEILKGIGSLTEYELKQALMVQEEKSDISGSTKLLGEIIIEEKMAHPSVVKAAVEKQGGIRKNIGTMRIDPEKLDNLINQVGELVINGANIKQIADGEIVDKAELNGAVSIMMRLIENIRANSMAMRMVPIGDTFKRFERVVRDLSSDKGKEIDLEITGGETELDKTLIEKINDPLMHLIRNSIDHGIDVPEERIKRDKSPRGKITLNAFHETGSVIIEVRDDGDGLNTNKIKEKAIAKGFIDSDSQLSESEINMLIFKAGFSTADEVTNISGRGVGMDVVKKNIESLRGNVQLSSTMGEGTLFRIQVPLTLSIIEGFMFDVSESKYVVPLDSVIECTEVNITELNSHDGGNYINLRGDVLPLVKLRDFFFDESEAPEIASVIVVRHLGGMAGLVVDNLIGEVQTVIKSLGDVFRNYNWISGSTILGNGDVALILDVPHLIKMVNLAH